MGQDKQGRGDGNSNKQRTASDNKENQEQKKRTPSPSLRTGLKPAKWKPASRIILRTPKTSKPSENMTSPQASSTVRLSPSKRTPLSTITKKPFSSLRETPLSQNKREKDVEVTPKSALRLAIRGGDLTSSPSPSTLRRKRDVTAHPVQQNIVGKHSPAVGHRDTRGAPQQEQEAVPASLKAIVDSTSVPEAHTPAVQTCEHDLSVRDDVNPSIPIEAPRPTKDASEEMDWSTPHFHAYKDLSGQDFEADMRSLLRNDRDLARNTETKSVKWDPAIVSCGPLTSITNKSKSKTKNTESTQRSEAPAKKMESNLKDFANLAADLKKGDQRLLQQILESLKDIESSDDSVVVSKPKRRAQKHKVKAHSAAGKDARSHGPQGNDPAQHASELTESKGAAKPATKLNPEAPAYRNFADVKARISPQKENVRQEGQWPLDVPRKRPRSMEGVNGSDIHEEHKANRYIPPALRTRQGQQKSSAQEPIWINTKSFLPEANGATGNDSPGFPGTTLPAEWLHNAQQIDLLQSMLSQGQFGAFDTAQPMYPMPMPVPMSLTSPYMSGYQLGALPYLQQPILNSGWGIMPDLLTGIANPYLSSEWYPLPTIQLPLLPLLQQPAALPTQSALQQPASTKRLPNENGPGRSAHTLDTAWAEQVLEKFSEKYPMTGKTRPPLPPPRPSKKKTHASAIQQKLEMLLYHEKEKRAFQELYAPEPLEASSSESATTSGNTNNSSRNSSVEILQGSDPCKFKADLNMAKKAVAQALR